MLLVDVGHLLTKFVTPLHFFSDVLLLELLFLIAEGCCGLVVLAGDGLFLLTLQLTDFLLHGAQLIRRGGQLHANPGTGLVDKVNCLVGQRTVVDVANTQVGCRFERFVSDLDPMVLLIQAANAVQDLDGLKQRRLIHEHWLETTFQGSVLFDVLTVLIERGCADALDLAAGKGWLEDVGRVDGALGGAGAHQSVQLIDKQHDLARLTDLVENLLEALLEFAAVLGPGNKRAHIEGQHTLAHQ